MNTILKKKLLKYGQYKYDIYNKMELELKRGNKILDVGCGDGQDGEIFIKVFGLKASAIDVFKHESVSKIDGLQFKVGSIYKIPFGDSKFDYVFLHNVLHHIDEKGQSVSNHKKALRELRRVCRNNGKIIILEANRYNLLFYPHLVMMGKHNHFTQEYFIRLIKSIFKDAKFKFFEAHFYPTTFIRFFKFYEFVMEKFIPKKFAAYNFSIIDVSK